VVGVVRAGWMTLESGGGSASNQPPDRRTPKNPAPLCFACTYQQSQRPHPGHVRRGPKSLGAPDHCPASPCRRLGLVPLMPPQHGAN